MEARTRPADSATAVMRLAKESDMAMIAAIERASFSDPWSVESFRSLLGVSTVHFAVASAGDVVVGYVVMWIAADEAEIANLAVAGEWRRRGTGTLLLTHAIRAAGAAHASVIFLEVRESNAAARALYAAHDFSTVGRRKRYYRRPEEDALVLRLDVGRSHS